MVFPQVDSLPRHPSQLYQFALEGVVLFVILWTYASGRGRSARCRACSCWATERCASSRNTRASRIAFLGYLAGGFTMGQLLSLPMIVIGVRDDGWAYRRAAKAEPTVIDRMK